MKLGIVLPIWLLALGTLADRIFHHHAQALAPVADDDNDDDDDDLIKEDFEDWRPSTRRSGPRARSPTASRSARRRASPPSSGRGCAPSTRPDASSNAAGSRTLAAGDHCRRLRPRLAPQPPRPPRPALAPPQRTIFPRVGNVAARRPRVPLRRRPLPPPPHPHPRHRSDRRPPLPKLIQLRPGERSSLWRGASSCGGAPAAMWLLHQLEGVPLPSAAANRERRIRCDAPR